MPCALTCLLALLASGSPAGSRTITHKCDVLLLAWSTSGELALVREAAPESEGGSALSFRVVGPGVEQKHFVVSQEVPGKGLAAVQRVGAAECRAALIELRDLLRAKRFKGVTLDSEACKADRAATVSVAPAQAQEAEAAELEAAGELLVRGDWSVRLEPSALTLASPTQRKRLRLPRPLVPGASHVLLSPSRRLLLVLESVEGGDQILAAGFASKTGEVADFE